MFTRLLLARLNEAVIGWADRWDPPGTLIDLRLWGAQAPDTVLLTLSLTSLTVSPIVRSGFPILDDTHVRH